MRIEGDGHVMNGLTSLYAFRFTRHFSENLSFNSFLAASDIAKIPVEVERERAELRLGLGLVPEHTLIDFGHIFVKPIPKEETELEEEIKRIEEEPGIGETIEGLEGRVPVDDAIEAKKAKAKSRLSLLMAKLLEFFTKGCSPTSIYAWIYNMKKRNLYFIVNRLDDRTDAITREKIPLNSDNIYQLHGLEYLKKLKELGDYLYNNSKNYYKLTNNVLDLLPYSVIETLMSRKEDLIKQGFLEKDWVEFVDFVTGLTANVPEQIRLGVKATLIPPVTMDFASHQLIITNAGTGKTRQFSKVGLVTSHVTRASLRGFATADKEMRKESILVGRREPFIIDQVESLEDESVLADIFALMDSGEFTVASGGELITIQTNAPIILLGNPPDSFDRRWAFYSLVKKIAQPAIARRFSYFIFDTDMPTPKMIGGANDLYMIEKRGVELIRRIALASYDKIFKLCCGLTSSTYCLKKWVEQPNEYTKEYVTAIEHILQKLYDETGINSKDKDKDMSSLKSEVDKKIDGAVIGFLTSIRESGKRINAMAINQALVDYLNIIFHVDLSEPISLEYVEKAGGEEAVELVKSLRRMIYNPTPTPTTDEDGKNKDEAENKDKDKDKKKEVEDQLLKEGKARAYEVLLALIITRAKNVYLPKLIEYNIQSLQMLANAYIDLRLTILLRYYSELAEYKKDIVRSIFAYEERYGTRGTGTGAGAGAGIGTGVSGEGIGAGVEGQRVGVGGGDATHTHRFIANNYCLLKKSKANISSGEIVAHLSKYIQRILQRYDTPTISDFCNKLYALLNVKVEVLNEKEIVFIIEKPELLRAFMPHIIQHDDFEFTISEVKKLEEREGGEGVGVVGGVEVEVREGQGQGQGQGGSNSTSSTNSISAAGAN
ncbi:MAG: hypothetical protein QW475_04570 [Candidatus Nitrosocaldus sp.]